MVAQRCPTCSPAKLMPHDIALQSTRPAFTENILSKIDVRRLIYPEVHA
jgi:hypothetical protein